MYEIHLTFINDIFIIKYFCLALSVGMKLTQCVQYLSLTVHLWPIDV